MHFDPNNPIVQLCAQGMYLEGQPEKARRVFEQAWEEASNDFEKCIAAHYLARQQNSVAEKLRWDETALIVAHKVPGETVQDFFPSLYLNVGKDHEDLGNEDQAKANYLLAEAFSTYLSDDGYGSLIKLGIKNGLARVR